MGRAARPNLKTKLIAVAVAFFVAAGGLSIYQLNNTDTGTTDKNQFKSTTTQKETKSQEEAIAYVGEQGKTALELLEKNAEVEIEQTDFGPMVTSINGRDGGGEKYWLFYVDGKMADVGAAEYETKDGEEIEWKLQ